MAGNAIIPGKYNLNLREEKVINIADGTADGDAVNRKQLNETNQNLTDHENDHNNPHSVDKNDVGLGNVDNIQQATKSEFNSHTGDSNNPHGVTKAQVGLGNVDNIQQATKSEFNSHTGNTSNPHSVTKAQVGLGNADNTSDVNKPVSTATQTALNLKQNQITVNDDGDVLTIPNGSGGTFTFTGGDGVELANTSTTPGMVVYDGTRYYLETNGGAFGRWSPYAGYAVGARVLLDQVLYECLEPVAESTDGSNMNPSTDIFLSTQRPGSTQAGQTSTTHWEYIAGPIQEFNAGDNYLKGSEIEYEHLGNKQTYVTLFSLNTADTTGDANTPERHSYRAPGELAPDFDGDTNVWYEHALGGFDGVGDHQSFDFPDTYPGAGFFIPVGSVWHHNGQEWRFEGPNQAETSHPPGTLYEVSSTTFNGNSGNTDPLTGIAAKHFPPNKYSGLWSETFGDNQWGPYNIYQPGQVVTFNVGTIAAPDWKEYIRTGAATTFAGAANPNTLFTSAGVLTAGWTENGPIFHTIDWENLPDDVTDFKIDDLVYFESSLFKARTTHTKTGTHPNPDEDPTNWDIVYGGLSPIDTLEALGDLTTANSNVLIGQLFLVMSDGANNGIYVVTAQNSTRTTSTLQVAIGQGGINVETSFPTSPTLGDEIFLDVALAIHDGPNNTGNRRPRGFYTFLQPSSAPESHFWEQLSTSTVGQLFNDARMGDIIYLQYTHTSFNGGDTFEPGFYRAAGNTGDDNHTTWVAVGGGTTINSIGDIADVDITGASEGDILQRHTYHNGTETVTEWVNTQGLVSVQQNIAQILDHQTASSTITLSETDFPGLSILRNTTLFSNQDGEKSSTIQPGDEAPRFYSNIGQMSLAYTGLNDTQIQEIQNLVGQDVTFRHDDDGVLTDQNINDEFSYHFRVVDWIYRGTGTRRLDLSIRDVSQQDAFLAKYAWTQDNANNWYISTGTNDITVTDLLAQISVAVYIPTESGTTVTGQNAHYLGTEAGYGGNLGGINIGGVPFDVSNRPAFRGTGSPETWFSGAGISEASEVQVGSVYTRADGGHSYKRMSTGDVDNSNGWTGASTITANTSNNLAQVTFTDNLEVVEIEAPTGHGLSIQARPDDDAQRSVLIEDVDINESTISTESASGIVMTQVATVNGAPINALEKVGYFLGTKGVASTTTVTGVAGNVDYTPFTTSQGGVDYIRYFHKGIALGTNPGTFVVGKGVWANEIITTTPSATLSAINLIG